MSEYVQGDRRGCRDRAMKEEKEEGGVRCLDVRFVCWLVA